MKIDTHSPIPMGRGENKQAEKIDSTSLLKSGQNSPARAEQAAPQDTVRLTGASKALHNLENRIKQSSGIDEDRVGKIKTAIRQGQYHIKADKLADKLLEVEASFTIRGHGHDDRSGESGEDT